MIKIKFISKNKMAESNICKFEPESLFLFVDVETNGLPKKRNKHYSEVDIWPRIVQMSWGIYNMLGEIVKFEDHIIKPIDFIIDAKSESIHGISQQKALDEGTELKGVLDLFQTDLKIKNLKYIICHNIKFDINVIKSELCRLGEKMKKGKTELLCTMLATINFCKLETKYTYSDYKYPKLEELYQILFNKKMEKAHDSKYDVINLAECYFKLMNDDSVIMSGVKNNINFVKLSIP
jgi:DNA polymerase III subunit alpha